MTDQQEQEALNSLKDTLNTLVQERNYCKSAWDDITTLVSPRRAGFDFNQVTQQKEIDLSSKRADGTATESATKYSDSLMGHTASPAYPWFRLASRDLTGTESRAVRAWYDQVEKHLYSVFARSNFYAVLPEVYSDGVTIATATLFIDEDIERQRPRFIAVHPFEIYIDEDENGNVTEVFRVYGMTQAQIERSWGKELADKVGTGNGQKHAIVHAVVPNDGKRGIQAPSRFPWLSVYYTKNDSNLLAVEGFYENPYVVWRYRKNTGEKYGRGPAYDLMPNIKTLNEVTKALARGVQLAVDPPLQAPVKLKGQIKIQPRGVLYWNKPNEKVELLQYQSQYSLGKDYHESLKDGVRRGFYVDVFMSMENLTHQMTIEEVLQRQGEKAAVLGSVAGRLGSELLDPIIQRVFAIELRAGRIPAPPEEVKRSGTKIEYMGPLFQAQKRYHQTQRVQQGLSAVVPLINVSPDFAAAVRHRINADGIVKEQLDAAGMPAATYRDDFEVAQIRQAEAQAAQEQQKQQMLMEAAKVVPDLSKAAQPGSPLDRILAAQQQQIGGMQ